jgi:hypothetical protein
VRIAKDAKDAKGATTARVTLLAPAEPMAWAVGTMSDGVFTSAWHAERALGAKAVAATREAVVEKRHARFVRVWGDDGSVSTKAIEEVST